VLDDVMVVIWKSSTKFNFTSRLSTWIFGIAHNMALKAFRKYAAEPAGLPSAPEEAIDEGATDAPALRDELRAAVARAVQTLPPDQRAVVELTFYHGHSYQEIAEIVGSPVNTIKTRMFYARQRLAPIFVKLGIAPTS
jgi:RNA polymerase sigma factor (sigma-70 family)